MRFSRILLLLLLYSISKSQTIDMIKKKYDSTVYHMY